MIFITADSCLEITIDCSVILTESKGLIGPFGAGIGVGSGVVGGVAINFGENA